MALQLLTLRPPPNVDFISGYPGLAPGHPDRPHAAVIGTLELRTPQPIKAKWVHVELRKIESVPGSPPFVDIIGSKPTVVWEPQGSEYGVLQSQDFYFSIRIPESVPPTVSLDAGRAGIRYELIATLCGKGKRSLLRRESSPLQTTSTEIVILKHEMHATWPVYAQPEERHAQKDRMTLTVSRRKTCLGAANDYIAIQAVLQSEIPISLKSFELALVQKLTYPNAGASQLGKKGAVVQPPPARSSLISEQKRPFNIRIQPGMHQTCELTCMLPPNYTAMTVATARLIENTYEIHVSAMLDGGGSISIGMPITVSPFPIGYSIEMMQRIGMPPMALDDPSRAHLHQQPQSRPASAASNGAGSLVQDPRPSQPGGPPIRQQRPYHIAERVGGQIARDESLLGGPPSPTPVPHAPAGSLPVAYPMNGRLGLAPMAVNTYPGDARSPAVNEFGQPLGPQTEAPRPVDVPTQPVVSPPTLGRFKIANETPRDELDSPRSSRIDEPYLTAADEKKRLAEQMADPHGYASVPPPGLPPPSTTQTQPNGAKPDVPKLGTTNNHAAAGGTSSQPTDKSKWLSAEQEKQRLFESAKAAADLTQRRAANTSVSTVGGGSMSKGSSPKAKQFTETQITPPIASTGSLSGHGQAQTPSSSTTPALSPAPTQKSSSTTGTKKWMPAEEEKRKLYEKAQARALKTQARAAGAASGASGVGRSNSTASATGSVNSSILNPYAFTNSTSSGLKGADLYKSAMNNVKAAAAATPSSPPTSINQMLPAAKPVLTPSPATPPMSTPPVTTVPVTVTPPPAVTPLMQNGSNWLSAEDEKARLRYLDAKRAVDRHVAAQEDDYGGGASGSSQYANVPSQSGYASPPPSAHQPWTMPPLSPPLNHFPPSIAPTPTPPASDPPPFEPSFGYTHATDIPEKEKMRLAYAQQETGHASQGPPDYTMPPSGPPPVDEVPSYGGAITQDSILSATEEKARLRAQFAAQDALQAGSSSGSGSGSATLPPAIYGRPSPEPPMAVDGSRKLTANEDKARILALQAAERPISSVAPLPPPRIKSPPPSAPLSAISEQGKSVLSDYSRPPTVSLLSTSSASSANDDHHRRDPAISQGKQRAPGSEVKTPFVVPPPPPLMPRPPVEYIEKTKEEDMKIRRMTQDAVNMTVYGEKPGGENGAAPWFANGFLNSPDNGFSLALRPFSPLDVSLDTNMSPIGQQSSAPSNGQRQPSYYR